MQIFIEITNAFKFPEWNTGTQRLMKSVARHTYNMEGLNCTPVVLLKDKFLNAQYALPKSEHDSSLIKFSILLDQAAQKVWLLFDIINSQPIFAKVSILQKILRIVFKVGCQPIATPLRMCRAIRLKAATRKLVDISMQPGDVLIWLGSPIEEEENRLLKGVKSKGIHIVLVVLDMFPITSPEWFSGNLESTKVPPIMRMADGIMAISSTVKDEVQKYFIDHSETAIGTLPWFDYFYLGSELPGNTSKDTIRPLLQQYFKKHTSIYLMVGTIEPRKNHKYAIDVFEKLWANNVDVALCIVGRIGWKCSELVTRLRNHPEWNRRLIMLNNINDAELEFCYQNSTALLYPSKGEGFGLPLVEAMQYRLPVMASDIPIFREIGQDFVSYFNINVPQSLYERITEYDDTGIFPAQKSVESWSWINWHESTRQLIERVVQNEKRSIE